MTITEAAGTAAPPPLDIIEAVGRALSEFDDMSDDTRARYRRGAKRVLAWYADRGVTTVDVATNDALVETLDLDFSRRHVRDRYVYRIVRMAEDVAWGRDPSGYHLTPQRYKHALDSTHRAMCEDLLSSLDLAEGTVRGVASTVRALMHALQEEGVDGPCELRQGLFADFVARESASRGSSMSNVAYALRLACAWLESRGFTGVPSEPVPQGVACRRERVLPTFSEDELLAILASPDASTPMGSRDYAVLALASTTGLRACDVAGLALSDVDWRTPSISHTQRKTGNVVSLPLMPHVARAMADYVLYHRPDAGRAAVFLAARPPHEALSAAGVRDVLYRHMALAGVPKEPGDGKTFHALRRGLGARLIESGAEADEVAQILGHGDRGTLRRYLPLAPDSIRCCALGLDGRTWEPEGGR